MIDEELKINNHINFTLTYAELLRAGIVIARTNGKNRGKSIYNVALETFGRDIMKNCVSVYRSNHKDYASSQLECEAIAFTPKLSEKEVEMNALQEKITELQLAYDKLKDSL
jgi:hypothetical protein